SARRILDRAGVDLQQVRFFHFATDRVWTRDYGPIFLVGPTGKVALTDWGFNGWAKYPNWHKDTQVPAKIGRALRLKSWLPALGHRPIVLEGGSIDVNGAGLLLTTEECLLSPIQARNPGLGRADLERVFADYLGVRKVLWLGRGIAGDDTHGHIDDLARFVGPRTIVTVTESDPSDANYRALAENRERAESMRLEDGSKLEIVPLPMPRALHLDRQRVPASYANFYVANTAVP